jgi:hypothetical protein
MAINILKRTRTLTEGVYSEWSEWETTSDAAPYVSTDLIEYRVATVFNDKFKESLDLVLSGAVAENTPYAKSLEFLETKLDALKVTNDVKGRLTAQFLSQVAISFTQTGINAAVNIANKDITADLQLQNLAKQGIILDKQAVKLEADIALVNAQSAAVTQQVEDNRKIKLCSILGDTYGMITTGSNAPSAEMWTTFFNKLNDLDTISVPASTAITKVV